MAVIKTFQGGEPTFASTRGTLTRIDQIAAPADTLARLSLCRVLVRTGIRVQLIRSIRRHDHSLVTREKSPKQERTKYEPTWSAEDMNAFWTSGWKRPEVVGAVEKAPEENKAKFDHLVDTEKMAKGGHRLLHHNSVERGAALPGQKTQRSERSEPMHK